MVIKVDRFAKKESYTIGRMYIDGVYFCDTLENTVRDIKPDGSGKIMHETAIPAGYYRVFIFYSPKFQRYLPLIFKVPFFTDILIHSGSTAEHTSGCILVGENKVKGELLNSEHYEARLAAIISDAIKRDEFVLIAIS